MSAISGTLHISTAEFNRALAAFARYSRKGGQEILMDAARNFVRRAVALTPPGKGKANAEAKRRGEATIAADLSRIFSPAPQDFIDRFIDFNNGRIARERFGHRGAAALGFIYTQALERADMPEWHSSRRRGDGRVMQVNREATTGLRKRDLRALDVGLVESKSYEWFKRKTQRRVGLLASGWNRAAAALGYKTPAWVRRHGVERGAVTITLAHGVFRIRIENNVPYAGGVKGLERRVQTALDQQATAMQRKVTFYLERFRG